jgi:hypothetical protein
MSKAERVNDAIALREPDMVPMTLPGAVSDSERGLYRTEVVYDTSLEKMKMRCLSI